jgi:hypothetical protein
VARVTAGASKTTRAAASPAVWLFGPGFDLPWLFGGALISVLAIALCLGLGVSVVAIWWAWLLLFDGPHMMAAYTRTYMAPGEWKRRRRLLGASLATFAVGPICLIAGAIAGRSEPFLLFLGGATLYGYYHVVRQHYGFVALYRAKAGERSRLGFYADKWCLYLGCWIPYVGFLITHPRARALVGLDEAAPMGVQVVLGGAWLACLLLWLAISMSAPPGARNPTKMVYGIGVVALHGLAYYVIGQYEPVYAASVGPDQDFLLLSVVITVLHNVQYVGLVLAHNRSRYRMPALRYLGICLSFSMVYFGLAALTGVFPGVTLWSHHLAFGVSVGQIGLALWWGLALHHYVLDQYIWRIHDDPSLREHLGLATSAAA